MAALPGVTGAVLNATTGRLVVTGRADLSAIRLEGRAEEYTVTPEGAEAPAAPAPRVTERERLIVAASAAVLGYAIRLLGGPDWLVIPAFAIATVAGGWSNFRKALRSIPRRDLNMSVLMSIAVAGAIAIGRYEEAGVVATLFAFSDMLESWTMDRARRSIRELMDIAPHSANIERGASVVEVPVAEVVVGDIMHVRPGEKIGMDGVVVGGSSAVNQAAITGESIPVEKTVGDDVYAGTLNVHGLLRVEVRRLVEDTTIARIIHMVEEAQARRAPLQTFVERFAAVYTPVVIALAAGIAVLPPLVAGVPWLPWIYRSLTLLVVSCPCALVVSTPVAIVSAISNAARNGVLIKGGVYLEQMGSVSAIAFDKTGTLTFGEPAVTSVEVVRGHEDVNHALALAAAVEQHSEHPLARAIMRAAHARDLNVPAAHEFEAAFGSGASATVDGRRLRIGSARLFPDASGTLLERVAELESQGNTVLLFGDHDGPSALIAVADSVRPESAGVITRLRESGIRHAVMLTGDNERVAAVVAAAVGTDRYEAGLLPEDKVGAMKRLVADYGSVAMVGDGVNDAPALATATIGIAMGGAGSDTALETADIVLLSDELDRLPFTVELSRATLRTIRANIAFAIGVKLIAVLAVVPGWLTLWIAILADMGASLVVTLNGIRMLKVGRKG